MNSPKQKEKRAAPETAAAIDFGPLEDSVGYLLRRAQIVVFQRFFELFAKEEVRPAQYSVLTVIQHNPGLSQTQLADALGIKKTNLVAMIDELEERSLARRMPTENDRRSRALFLTPKGHALMSRLHRLDGLIDQRLTQTLSAGERRQFCEALRRVASV
ncbi:MAG: MarR family transcriptional regulator [Polycyclovorans sp.]|nr:MarR family transcriptional regulator [Polycyclovorans sp.]